MNLNIAKAKNQWSIFRAMRIALAICAFVIFDQLICQRLYQGGHLQQLLGVFNSLAYVLSFPGAAATSVMTRCPTERITGANWCIFVACNFVLYFMSLCTLARIKHFWKNPTPTSGALASGGDGKIDLHRRRFFKKSFDIAIGSTLSGAMGYSLVMEPGEIRVNHLQFPVHDLPKSLNGLRLAQVSDIHHGPWLSIEHVRRVVEKTNALDADLILLTGDYVYDSPVYIEPVAAELAKLKSRIGSLAILGNHDWWHRGVPIKSALAQNGIPLIDNSRVMLTADRKIVNADTGLKTEHGLWIAGVGDLWEDFPDYRAALHGLPAYQPCLLLAHNPDAAEDQKFLAGNYRVDLMISGHTHGGQAYVPGLGTAWTPSRFGDKYRCGLVQGPASQVFVSRGLGEAGVPLRLNCPPEINLLTFASVG